MKNKKNNNRHSLDEWKQFEKKYRKVSDKNINASDNIKLNNNNDNAKIIKSSKTKNKKKLNWAEVCPLIKFFKTWLTKRNRKKLSPSKELTSNKDIVANENFVDTLNMGIVKSNDDKKIILENKTNDKTSKVISQLPKHINKKDKDLTEFKESKLINNIQSAYSKNYLIKKYLRSIKSNPQNKVNNYNLKHRLNDNLTLEEKQIKALLKKQNAKSISKINSKSIKKVKPSPLLTNKTKTKKIKKNIIKNIVTNKPFLSQLKIKPKKNSITTNPKIKSQVINQQSKTITLPKISSTPEKQSAKIITKNIVTNKPFLSRLKIKSKKNSITTNPKIKSQVVNQQSKTITLPKISSTPEKNIIINEATEYVRNLRKEYEQNLTPEQKKLRPKFKSDHIKNYKINSISTNRINYKKNYSSSDNNIKYQKVKNNLSKNNNNFNITETFKINESKHSKLNSMKLDYKIQLTKKRFIYVFGDDKKNDAYFKLISDGRMSISLIPKWETLLFWHTKISLLTRLPMIFGAMLLIIAFIIFESKNSYTDKYHLNIILFFDNIFGKKVNSDFIKKYNTLVYLIASFCYWIMFMLPIVFLKRKKIIINICYFFLGINALYLIWIISSYIFYDTMNSNIISSVIVELLGISILIISNSVLLFLLKKDNYIIV